MIVAGSAKSSNRQEKAASNAQLQSKLKKKGGAENRWNSRGDKQTYTHPWLLTSLKGHSGQVLDMDFSHNGKYLASCADGEFLKTFFTFCKFCVCRNVGGSAVR